jgi:Predicted sugar kinase
MERFAIVKKNDELSYRRYLEIKEALEKTMCYDEKNPELVISIGGDGTMLDACHQYMDQVEHIYFVGVHTGTLGFYADYNHHQWQKLVTDIQQGNYRIDRRSLLKIEIDDQTMYALNEMRLEENHRTMVCDVYLNDEFLECFRGNGLCVSTPSGSTAYNRSLGGSIIAASIPSLQLSEIAGIHHNAYRSLQSSLVLDESVTITLKPQMSQGMILGVDRETIPFGQDNSYVKISVAKQFISFVHFHQVTLCQRLRRAFISE